MTLEARRLKHSGLKKPRQGEKSMFLSTVITSALLWAVAPGAEAAASSSLIALDDSLAPLRDGFNKNRGKRQLVAILSPT